MRKPAGASQAHRHERPAVITSVGSPEVLQAHVDESMPNDTLSCRKAAPARGPASGTTALEAARNSQHGSAARSRRSVRRTVTLVAVAGTSMAKMSA